MDSAREWLKQARSVAVLTGAGVSAESGVPTFRGNGGLWKQYRAESLATPQAFARDPKLVWEWYDWRRSVIAEVRPNPGHYALVELEKRTPIFTLITQNVDGLHELAGSRNVLRLHGSIWTLRCLDCGRERDDRAPRLAEIPPYCECGGMLRPGVVWFGEALPPNSLGAGRSGRTVGRPVSGDRNFGGRLSRRGTCSPSRNPPAREWWKSTSQKPTLSDEIDEFLQGPSGELLPRLIA